MQNQIMYPSVPYSERIYSGVTFNGKKGWKNGIPGLGGFHTWDNWQAYWTDLKIDAPETEIFTVDIPGRHGLLDLSETLTGAPVYKNRTIIITLTYPGSGTQWHEEYSEILAQLHGRMIQMILDSDSEYYYEGRCTVSSQRKNNVYSQFTISLNAFPYKYEVFDSLDTWLWDSLNFETDIIREYGDLTIPANSTLTVSIVGSQMLTYPRITVSADCSVEIDGVTYSLVAGTNTNIFSLENEVKSLIFHNSSDSDITLSIYFRGGKL